MKILFILSFLIINICSAKVDHEHKLFTAVLQEFTLQKEQMVYVDYEKLSRNSIKLTEYLSQLESITYPDLLKLSREQRLAFWINAYNAYTLKLVTTMYPIDSIKDIESGNLWNRLLKKGPWKLKFIPLFGMKMSLDDIEHGVLRPKYNEPRIHFAINCASMSCPPIRREAFRSEVIEEQLQNSTLSFLTDQKHNEVIGNEIYASKIFKWFGEDFDKKYGSVIKFFSKTLKLNNNNYKLNFKSYDWNLNDIKNIK